MVFRFANNKLSHCDMRYNNMENEELEKEHLTEEPKKGYVPRPAWQVWAARVGLVIMIISVILYYWHIASGGMQ